jgi:hypothetical protein
MEIGVCVMFVCSLSAALQDMPSEKVLLNADVYGGAIHCAFTKNKTPPGDFSFHC